MLRWAVLLEGPAEGLKDWEDQLPVGFDPWVEVDHGRHVLRSEAFDQFSSSDGAAYASWLVRVLAGAIAVQVGRTGVSEGGLAMYLPNGRRIYTSRPNVIVSRRARAGLSGPAAPTESLPQKWALAAASDPFIGDALSFFGGDQDWFDIYKALESLELKYGGERGLLELAWVERGRIKLLKATANSGPRHPARKYPPPANPMPLNVAQELIAELIAKAVDALEEEQKTPRVP